MISAEKEKSKCNIKNKFRRGEMNYENEGNRKIW